MFFFMHIPKTAGSSLRSVMKSHYAADEFVEVYRGELNLVAPNAAFIAQFKAANPRPKVVFGHFSFGVHNLLNVQDARYLTLLRDPVQRAVSIFAHMSRDPNSRYSHLIQDGMTLRQLILSHRTVELNNHYTRMLLGEPQWGVSRAPARFDLPTVDQLFSPSHYDQAMENKTKYFSFIGAAEQFENSVKHLARTMNWPEASKTNDLPHQNTRPDSATPLDAETLAVIRHYNALDIELYRRANSE